jgi:hypothetical protein
MKSVEDVKNMRGQYIYLIREREFIRMDTQIYKVGKTTQTPNARMRGYPKHSEVVLFVKTVDCHISERVVIKAFKEQFTHRPDFGAEYFEGDVSKMIGVIINVTHNVKLSEIRENKVLVNTNEIKTTLTHINVTGDRNNKHCFSCGKTFKCRSDYVRHKDRKTPCVIRKIDPTAEHRCKFCNRTYKHKRSLTSHSKKCKTKNGGVQTLLNKLQHEHEMGIQNAMNRDIALRINDMIKEIKPLKSANTNQLKNKQTAANTLGTPSQSQPIPSASPITEPDQPRQHA